MHSPDEGIIHHRIAMVHDLSPATRPTMYFIGVTTRHSSINQVFPRWADHLQLGDCELRGLDIPVHAETGLFRAVVEFIKRDSLSLGALITTHKIDLYRACRDQFDAIDPLSDSLAEIGSIYKRAGRLHGRAVDPWTSAHALDAFVPHGHWSTGAETLILGAGGAGSALAWHLCNAQSDTNRPACVHLVEHRAGRLEQMRQLHASWPRPVNLDCHVVSAPEEADRLVSRLAPGSLVVNATGMGKDVPGSPLTDAAVFPEEGLVWEFNYRGDLVFLAQARAQQQSRRLHVEDGWKYFLHGWTRVMVNVFDREIPAHGPLFDELGRIAASTR